LGQHLAARLGREWNDENPDHKGDRRECHGQSQGMCVQHRRAEQEVHARTDKTSERRAECKGRRPYTCLELLGQPQAEEREVATEKAKQEQPRDERRKPIR
jgi:hypothetical protein